MKVTVTTLKDELANVQRFVRGNLAGGADHLVVFLESADEQVRGWLEEHPAVSVVVADADWWQQEVPSLLNTRQRINVDVAMDALTHVEGVEWLFHVDGDEIVRIDDRALAAVPEDRVAVRLRPLEVVAELHPQGQPHLFKPLLRRDELSLLKLLGVVGEADNAVWFRSHTAGKVGVRVRPGLYPGIHKVTDAQNERIPLVRNHRLTMLHLESFSGDEFVRKWTAMIGSGPKMHFGSHRIHLGRGLKAALALDVDDATRTRLLERIFAEHIADPVDLLGELNLLVEVDPGRPLGEDRTPVSLSPAARTSLEAGLEAWRGRDKWQALPEPLREGENDVDGSEGADGPDDESGSASGEPRLRDRLLRRR